MKNLAFERNDPRQYDTLVDEWWKPRGAFAMLHWIARARADLIPSTSAPRADLLDIGCGGGLLAPYVANKGYRHIGIDINASALQQSGEHGVTVIRGDATALPFPDETFDVVCAGEILEHVSDMKAVIAESSRVLKAGGLMVIDTIADTRIARFLAVTIAERIPGGAPHGLHDSALFVNRADLVREYAHHGVQIKLRGLRPSLRASLLWLAHLRRESAMVPTFSTAVLFQGWGRKTQ